MGELYTQFILKDRVLDIVSRQLTSSIELIVD